MADRTETQSQWKNLVIPYMAGVSVKIKRIFGKHHIPEFFKPTNRLRQRLIHPKDRTPKHKRSNVVYAIQCNECSELYVGETEQPLHRRMAQHRRIKTTGPESAVYLHLKEKEHSFEDINVHILDKEDRWFERGVKESIHAKVENPSLNRGGGLRYNLSPIFHAALSLVPRKIKTTSQVPQQGHI